jgi:predicted RNA polymerase sigma factor
LSRTPGARLASGPTADAPSYDQTDWPQIVVLYDRLLQVWPSPVVALNRVVPVSMVAGPEAALTKLERLEHDEREVQAGLARIARR